MTTASRVAGRFLYARILRAMSEGRAKEVLGFPPDADPDPAEVNRVYRKLAPLRHPDQGGTHEEMVELNVAKDVLMGKAAPTRDTGPSYRPSPAPYKPPPPQPDNVVTFEEAKGKAGVPSGVDWIFVTERQRGSGSYSGDESSASDTAWVAYGRTGGKHVFVAMRRKYYQAFFVGGGPKTDVWTMQVLDFPIKGDEGKNPAWLYAGVIKSLKATDWGGKFNSRVIPAKGWTFNNPMPHGAATSLKHLLVNIGEVAGDDPSVATRKHVIEMLYDRQYMYGDDSPKAGYHPVKPWYSPTGKPEYYKVVVFVNSKPFELEATDVEKVAGLRLKGGSLIDIVFKDKYSGTKKNLTRSRDGKKVLQFLLDKLTKLPDWVREALTAAAAQMKG